MARSSNGLMRVSPQVMRRLKHGVIASKKAAHDRRSGDPTGDGDRMLIVDAG